jgi:asparagine synthase (glutamine-hydrolysing)
MCGIAGLWTSSGRDPELIERMHSAVRHRGPDDAGAWSDASVGLHLGHQRLSIIDLSTAGHQPMMSRNGRYVLTYNGEIYNHRELRRMLDVSDSIAWRGSSDTETLLECIAEWGVTQTLQRCVGMFAFALWDRHDQVLTLARDRFGEKPLYFGWVGGDFLFGSELKALRTHPAFDNEIDQGSVRLLLSRTYIPAPKSIYRHIYKLQPGCKMTVTREALRSRPSAAPASGHSSDGISIESYWFYRSVVERGHADPITDVGEAREQLEDALRDAITGQSIADVPVGAFLSGGVDSSTIVALYQKYSSSSVKSYSIGFEEEAFNEAEHARRVAEHLGTDHHELYVSYSDAHSVIPHLPQMYDEPFADASQIPTYLICKAARAHVKVALTGDGGDELFGGYTRYFAAPRLWALARRPGARPLARAARALPPRLWSRLAAMAPGLSGGEQMGPKLRKALNTVAEARDPEGVFNTFLEEWSGEIPPVRGQQAEAHEWSYQVDLPEGAPESARMMFADTVAYLPDDILCKVDRASMAVSLETRLPFLDHRVAEVAARLPMELKISGGVGKRILREILHNEVPRHLVERPKAGFGVPVGQWMRGELRDWAEELLSERRLADHGFFEVQPIRARWLEHVQGRRDATSSLWAILMFQAWMDAQRSNAPADA